MAIFTNFSAICAVLSLQLILICASVIVVNADDVLENNKVYKIENKGDKWVLSVNSSADSIVGEIFLQKWDDTGNQKWRAKQPTLERILYGKLSYEFIPTSNDDFRLGVDSTLTILASFLGDNKYWSIIDVGENAKEIKNYELETCVGSQGLDMPVILVVCDNSESTRWTFIEL